MNNLSIMTLLNRSSITLLNRTAELDRRFHFINIIPYCFVGIGVIGIILNAVTFIKLKMARRHSSTTRLSLQLLSSIAVADGLCLFALLFMVTVNYFQLPIVVMTVLCKLDVFVVHAASAFSVWCWLLQSLVRYAAIFFPYFHLKYADDMNTLVAAVAAAVSFLESWILVVVQYDAEGGICKEELDPALNTPFHLFEILWSYFFPVILITVLDARVMFCTSSAHFATISEADGHSVGGGGMGMNLSISEANSAARRTSKTSHSRNRRNLNFLRRCIVIALADLFMNLPSYTLRLLMIIIGPQLSEMFSQNEMNIIEAVAQLLYFGQFSCNAFYLVYVIYGTRSERTERIPSISLKENSSKHTLRPKRNSRLTY
uniref:G-protein coupled receptors family 1 profile domain-containing protein n=1 Tax=Plectus sambesii TaxID=2011161 RepID=A0A914WJ17_9BILA